MLNTIIGYYIGCFKERTGKDIDFIEFISHPEEWVQYRDKRLERFMDINRMVQSEDDDACTRIFHFLEESEIDEKDLPFYLLPIAYHPNLNLEETSRFLDKILKNLSPEKSVLRDTVLVVMSVKWGLYTKSSPLCYLSRLFPDKVKELLTYHSVVNDALLGFYELQSEPKGFTDIESAVKSACNQTGNLPVKSALAAAFAEVLSSDDYQYEMHQENDTPFLFAEELPCDWDKAVEKGYQRVDGYYSWVMKSGKKELCMHLIGDENGPDRDMLRTWHMLDKKLNMENLYQQVDDELKSQHLWKDHEKWKEDIQNIQIDLQNNLIQFTLVDARRPICFEIKNGQISLDCCLNTIFRTKRAGRPAPWLKKLLEED